MAPLHTVRMTSAPDGDAWCSIDRGVDENFRPPMADAFWREPYIEISNVERSTPSDTLQLTALAGTSCGIARAGETVTYYDTTHQLETCFVNLPAEEKMAAVIEEDIDNMAGGDVAGRGPDRDYDRPVRWLTLRKLGWAGLTPHIS